jgi:ferritin
VTAAYDIEAELGTKYEDWYKKSYNVTTQQFLLQYIEKQRVSVGEFGDLLARLELVKDDSAGILMIDAEMGKS